MLKTFVGKTARGILYVIGIPMSILVLITIGLTLSILMLFVPLMLDKKDEDEIMITGSCLMWIVAIAGQLVDKRK